VSKAEKQYAQNVWLQQFVKNKNISQKLKLRPKNTNNRQSFNIRVRNQDTNKVRWKANEYVGKEGVEGLQAHYMTKKGKL
jgi:hypothetical protein